MSEPIFQHKHIFKEYIVDIKVFRVDKDEFHPDGFQYSLVLIKGGRRLIGFDNHER